jgi:hypothetical protein
MSFQCFERTLQCRLVFGRSSLHGQASRRHLDKAAQFEEIGQGAPLDTQDGVHGGSEQFRVWPADERAPARLWAHRTFVGSYI